jgi:hypothetical protein
MVRTRENRFLTVAALRLVEGINRATGFREGNRTLTGCGSVAPGAGLSTLRDALERSWDGAAD